MLQSPALKWVNCLHLLTISSRQYSDSLVHCEMFKYFNFAHCVAIKSNVGGAVLYIKIH